MPQTVLLWIATVLCAQVGLGYWRAWGSFVAYPAQSGGTYGYSLPPPLIFIVGNVFVLLPVITTFGAAAIAYHFARQRTKAKPTATPHRITQVLGIFLGVWLALLAVVMLFGKPALPALFKWPW